MPSKPTVARTCLQCRRAFQAQASQVNKGAALYCSVQCSNTSRRKAKAWTFAAERRADMASRQPTSSWWTAPDFNAAYQAQLPRLHAVGAGKLPRLE